MPCGVAMLATAAWGMIPGWATLIALVAVGWIMVRGGTGTAVSGLQDANRELERQIKQRDGQLSALERVNAELRAEKDVSVAIVPVIEAMRAHEERAQDRHVKMIVVLELIAQRLGPDNGNGT